MKRLMTGLLALLVLSYPFLIYFGSAHLSPRYLALCIGFLFCLRLVILSPSTTPLKSSSLVLASLGVGFCLLAAVFDNALMIRLYPVAVNALLLGFFAYSLFSPQTIIERFARMREPALTPKAIAYTRKVTLVWCAFFCFNGTIALWTGLWASIQVWTFYNGFLSYLLIALVFAIECCVRRRLRRTES